ncbi:Cysteine protease, C1A family [Butyrivibrio proteoclasticus]|uniref:Cysteine protease, C1A family n=1 Tax=Butyrivibrio proteoclasticus TaxID=43305 RepID=A0A1I5WJC3_9FIRM|nr:C1 family peptidase [Butyrivibrio proteoclasticus]SFQ19873.1 Cysteine protease, C1A family [Butyrivibrio proteoclasticus]
MKKKILIISAVVVVLITAAMLLNHNIHKEFNSSRRDEYVPNRDEDLTVVDGSEVIYNEGTSKEDAEAVYHEAVVGESKNNPTSLDVQNVREIVIPEAVPIADGKSGEFYSNEDFINVIPTDISTFSGNDLPTKYDSRDADGKRFVTGPEDQGYSYLCWTYAALGAIESDILKHNEDLNYTDIDLSEKHLAYYNVHKAEGKNQGYIEDDYRELVNADNEDGAWIFDYDSGYVAVGGVTDYCISLLAAWKGPVSEKGNDKFNSMYGQDFLFKENGEKPSDAFESNYHVQDVSQICASVQNRTYVKQMIFEHGAVTAGVNADSVYWKDHNKNLYSYFDGEKAPTPNHEILIVGWNDDYPASEFGGKPLGDGAWICKNSWGTNGGEGGFFYLSYYDETTCSSNVAAYSVSVPESENWYDNNYQAAGFITNVVDTLDDDNNYVYALTGSNNPYGMMYEAQGEEMLEAIGLMAIDSYQQYDVEIYLNPEFDDAGIDIHKLKEPSCTQKISAISGGYHTFKLDDGIKLEEGDNFFVMIKPHSNGRLVFEKAADYVSEANYDEWNNLTGNIHNHYEASGASYYISDDGKMMEKQNDKDFFVKAYTKNQ